MIGGQTWGSIERPVKGGKNKGQFKERKTRGQYRKVKTVKYWKGEARYSVGKAKQANIGRGNTNNNLERVKY